MSGTISTTQTSAATLVSALYADPLTIAGEIDVASGNAVVAPTAWTIDITGVISASLGSGITLQSGGSIDNSGYVSAGAVGLISTSGKPFQIDNQAGGTIIGAGTDAIRLSGDVTTSTFTNAGLVAAEGGGVGLLLGAANGLNAVGGVISGGTAGVQLGNVTQFTNDGTITGTTGILVPYGQNYVTIVEAGLISASTGDAVSFATGSASSVTDFLTIMPGASLTGIASGGQVADLVFAGSSPGTVADIGHEFVLFPTISIAAGAVWEFAGTSTVASAFENDGQLLVQPGEEATFVAGVGGTGSIDLGGGFIDFTNTVAAGQIVDFGAAGATMLFDSAHPFAGTVAGFAAGDTIEVTGFGVSQQVTGTLSGDVLTLNDGMTPVTITFASSPGSLVVEPISGIGPKTYEVVVPCFRSGTRLMTPEGMKPVESLSAGDLVITRSGAARPVIWHGWRRVDCRRHPAPQLVWPIMIEKNACGAGIPCRDLYVSPDHAIWFDEGLIEAKYLVNDVTIRQVERPEVTYHHIELASHDAVLAEMLPAETYLDCGNRQNFETGGVIALHPSFGPPAPLGNHAHRPLISDGPALAAIRSRLHGHVLARGARPGEGRFGVFARGELLPPIEIENGRRAFLLPEDIREVAIASTASTPAALDPHATDRRRLGVALTRIELDGCPIDITGPRVLDGFHVAEPAGSGWFRWTDGAGRLDVSGARSLAFSLQAIAPVWTLPAAASSRRRPRRRA